MPRSARRFEHAFSSDQEQAPGSLQRLQVSSPLRRPHRVSEQPPAADSAVEGGPKRLSPRASMKFREVPDDHAVQQPSRHGAARQDLSHHMFTGGEAPHAPIRTSATPTNAR